MKSLRRSLDFTVNSIATVVHPFKPAVLAPIHNSILLLPATELAEHVATGHISSVAIVTAFIERIREVNPIINAVVDERFTEALEEARLIDELIANSDENQRREILKKKPFLGVPVTTKNLVAVKGMLIDVGLKARRGTKAESDAEAITNVRKAGAIPLAITNVSELAMWWESNNKVHGRTKNPYDPRRNAGGSSGGEGSLLSAAGSVIGIGTDIGGSIRMPAFFNGIFGHKPSPDIVPNTGHFPVVVDVQKDFLGTGPMCRYAKDLLPLMVALAGKENSEKLKLSEDVDVTQIKVYFMEEIKNRSFLMTPVSGEVKRALHDVVDHLSRLSKLPAEEKNFEQMPYAFEIWNHLMTSGNSPKFTDVLKDSGSSIGSPYYEAFRWATGMSDHTFPSVCVAIGERVVPSKESQKSRHFVELGLSLREQFLEILDNKSAVFICPTHPEPAPRHNVAIFRGCNFSYTGIFNVLKLPVTACPVRLGEHSGLPVGIQVVAGPNQDRLCLAVAREIESAFGGWRNPSTVVESLPPK